VEELATALDVSEDTLLKYASVWMNHGVVTLSADRHELVAATSLVDSRRPFQSGEAIADEMETAVSSDAQAAEDLQTLETYVVGMLANFGSLPIQRIHNMLSTFARSGAHPCKALCVLESVACMKEMWC
jgi:anaphase-promoting complex subunit 2